MWKAFLPPQRQQLRCTYQINGMPLLEWIAKQVVRVMGNVNIKHIKVAPKEIILSIPNQDLPYKIANITIGDITIQLKKE